MEDLVASILAFPPSPPGTTGEYDKQANQLVKNLGEISASTLAAKVVDGDTLLELFNPAEHAIAYVFVLSATIDALQKKSKQALPPEVQPDGHLFPKLLLLVENFDPVQVRYVGALFRNLLETLLAGLERSSQPWNAVPLIRDAILRLDPSSSTLTSTHIHFVYLCLRLKLYRDALPILDRDIYNIPQSSGRRNTVGATNWAAQESSVGYLNPVTGLSADINTRDYLQYFMYAAIVHLALRQWHRALVFLEIVLITPTHHAASLIQIEAYKKYVLIGLLLQGKPLSPPRTVNQQAMRTIKALSKPYDVLAEAFVARDLIRLRGDLDVGRQEGIWQKDSNLGLIQEVLKAFRKFAVLRLADTFTALPISEVARRTSPNPTDLSETQQYISELIVGGELKASTNQDEPPTLRFLEGASMAMTEVQLAAEITKRKEHLAVLLELISRNDHRLEISREYVEHLQRLKKAKDDEEKATKQGVAQGRKSEPLGSHEMIDEDMMADA